MVCHQITWFALRFSEAIHSARLYWKKNHDFLRSFKAEEILGKYFLYEFCLISYVILLLRFLVYKLTILIHFHPTLHYDFEYFGYQYVYTLGLELILWILKSANIYSSLFPTNFNTLIVRISKSLSRVIFNSNLLDFITFFRFEKSSQYLVDRARVIER